MECSFHVFGMRICNGRKSQSVVEKMDPFWLLFAEFLKNGKYLYVHTVKLYDSVLLWDSESFFNEPLANWPHKCTARYWKTGITEHFFTDKKVHYPQ